MNIGIVCDQPTVSECLRGTVAHGHEHRVAWVASSGQEAVDRCLPASADLVLLVLRRDGLNGAETTRRIMSAAPCPILLVALEDASPARVFDAMSHGALDAIDLPSLTSTAPMDSAAMLLKRIATIGGAIRERSRPSRVTAASPVRSGPCDYLIAIGASAGGPAALAAILSGVPPDLPASIVIVQHVDEQFTAGMASWLSDQSGVLVRLALSGDRVGPGVYLAGTGDHLVLRPGGVLAYTEEPRQCVYRPSVDVFFESVSRHWQSAAVGVLLTGMGKDGAIGLRRLRESGHHTIAQDAATSAVYGMPKAAVALGAAAQILPMQEIAPRLVALVSGRRGVKSGLRQTPHEVADEL